jgi:hypothetical protein
MARWSRLAFLGQDGAPCERYTYMHITADWYFHWPPGTHSQASSNLWQYCLLFWQLISLRTSYFSVGWISYSICSGSGSWACCLIFRCLSSCAASKFESTSLQLAESKRRLTLPRCCCWDLKAAFGLPWGTQPAMQLLALWLPQPPVVQASRGCMRKMYSAMRMVVLRLGEGRGPNTTLNKHCT